MRGDDEIEVLNARFTRERVKWWAGSGEGLTFIYARHVTETAPSGAIYVRLATPIEDELLDKLIEAGFWTP